MGRSAGFDAFTVLRNRLMFHKITRHVFRLVCEGYRCWLSIAPQPTVFAKKNPSMSLISPVAESSVVSFPNIGMTLTKKTSQRPQQPES